MAIVPTRPPFELPPGACGDICGRDEKVRLSLYASPAVVHQVGDIIKYYAKITNLTDEAIPGVISIYIAGIKDAAVTLELEAFGYADLVIPYTVTDEDFTRKFIVQSIYARVDLGIDKPQCMIGNVASATVAVDAISISGSDKNIVTPIRFINTSLNSSHTGGSYDIEASLDIINFNDVDADILNIDVTAIFGPESELTYIIINNSPDITGDVSDLFVIEGGRLFLAEGKVFPSETNITLIIKGTSIMTFLCSESCTTTASWRLIGYSTMITVLNW